MNPLGVLRDIITEFSTAPAWVQLLIKATLLLAVAWLIHFGLARANPRWRTLLWRGVAVGLVLMAVLAFGLPGVEIQIPVPESVATAPAPPPQPILIERDSRVVEADALHRAEFPSTATMKTTPGQDPVEAQPQAARPVESSGQWLAWPIPFLVVWCFGVALLAIRLAAAVVRLERSLRTLPAAAEDITAEVARIAATLGCRRQIQVRTSRIYAVPFQYGLMRPVLVLPERMCQPACRAQLPAVIAHELAHVRSWDFGWNAALQTTSTMLWFHPLAWRIGSVHRAACDAVCDAVAASYLGDVRAYCRTLASVALAGVGRLPVLGLPMSRKCDVRRRIARLEAGLSASRLSRRVIAAAAFAGLLSIGLLAGLRFAPAEPISAEKGALVFAVAKEDPDGGQAAAATGTDLYGDPLPPGAIARLGTVRYRSEHGDTPEALAFSDNKSVVALTWDFRQLRSSLRWWNLADGKLVRTVRPADITETRVFAQPLAGAITPDGKIAAAWIGGYHLPPGGGKPFPRSWIKWWEVQTGRELASIPCDDTKSASYLALASDGITAVTAREYPPETMVRVWDRLTKKQVAAFDAKGYVRDLAISPAGKTAAFLTDAGAILWEFGSGQPTRTVIPKSDAFRPAKLAFSPDGKTLVVAGYPSQIRFLDAAGGQLLRTLPAPDWSKSFVTMLAFPSDGKQLALGAMHTVTVWDLASGKPRHTLETPMYEVDYGAFSPDGRLLAVANRFIGSVDAWDLATEKRLSEGYVEHSSRDGSVAWLAENKLVATTDINGMIRLWEARTGRQKTLIRCDNHNVAELAISPDGNLLAWVDRTSSAVRIWDAYGQASA